MQSLSSARSMSSHLITLGASVFLALFLFAGFAKAASVNVDANGLALQGYDPVAYFSENAAVKGGASVTAEYNGSKYQFKNAENRDLFLANPSKYAPQYGGYCAYAASKGALAKGDPEAWTIYEGKLYLNFSKSVRSIWQQDIPGHIEKANTNFPKLLETWPNVTEW